MNLTKLFNFKYLKQNLKKSKGLLVISILIVPVITVLMLLSINNSKYDFKVEEGTYNFINIICMYVFPFLLSVILTGYVYKRNSVDFINSMPINRKTIYLTNFIGGIFIIAVTQVLTLIAGLVCSNIFTEIFLPVGLIVDRFVVMFISYIFVYSVTMLALTLSGNMLTQIVVTALILFLVPFSHMIFFNNGINTGTKINIDYGGGICQIEETSIIKYAMPFRIISTLFYGSSAGFYNTTSIVRMLVLSIVYLIIGIILFDKRKMENNGSSFEKFNVHYLVKGLTMVPMVFLARVVEAEGVYIAIIITLMFIYYVLYDFILNKKAKLKYTIPLFIITVLILAGIYEVGSFINEKTNYKDINVNEISGISVSLFENYFRTDLNQNESLKFLVDDSEMIKKILENTIDDTFYMTEDYTVEDKIIDYNKYVYTSMRIKLKNGKNIYSYIHLDKGVYEEVKDYISQKYEKEISEMYDLKSFAIISDNKLLSTEDTKRIQEILKQNKYNVESERVLSSPTYTEICVYNNHAIKTLRLDINVDKEIFDIITKFSNKNAYLSLSKMELTDKYSYSIEVTKYVLQNNEYNEYHNSSKKISNELINYVENHYQDACDMDKEFVTVQFYSLDSGVFYTNLTDELNEILDENGWVGNYDYPIYVNTDYQEAIPEEVVGN